MNDYTGQQFQIAPRGMQQPQADPVAQQQAIGADREMTDMLGLDLTGLQELEGVTSEVYNLWGELNQFARQMDAMGINVTRPDITNPQSFEANKIFMSAMANIKHKIGKLKGGGRLEPALAQAKMQGLITEADGVNSRNTYNQQRVSDLDTTVLPPEILQYNAAVRTAMDDGEDIAKYDEMYKSLVDKYPEHKEGIMRAKKNVERVYESAADKALRLSGAKYDTQLKNFTKRLTEINTVDEKSLIAGANKNNLKDIRSDKDTGRLKYKRNIGTTANPNWVWHWIERTPENGFGATELFQIYQEGLDAGQRKDWQELENNWSQYDIATNARTDDGWAIDPVSANEAHSNAIREAKANTVRAFTEELSLNKVPGTDDNSKVKALIKAAPNMAIPPGVDDVYEGKGIASITYDNNNFLPSAGSTFVIKLDNKKTLTIKTNTEEGRRKLATIIDWNSMEIDFPDFERPDKPQPDPVEPASEELTEGDVEDGYRYLGGDPLSENSWEKVN